MINQMATRFKCLFRMMYLGWMITILLFTHVMLSMRTKADFHHVGVEDDAGWDCIVHLLVTSVDDRQMDVERVLK